MSWIARATSSLKRKNPANNSKAIEISLRIGNSLECSYSLPQAVSASGEMGDFFATFSYLYYISYKRANNRVGNPRDVVNPF